MSDLPERLRAAAKRDDAWTYGRRGPLLREAAEEVELAQRCAHDMTRAHDEARAEVERLRAVLKRIADRSTNPWRTLARAALDPKGGA